MAALWPYALSAGRARLSVLEGGGLGIGVRNVHKACLGVESCMQTHLLQLLRHPRRILDPSTLVNCSGCFLCSLLQEALFASGGAAVGGVEEEEGDAEVAGALLNLSLPVVGSMSALIPLSVYSFGREATDCAFSPAISCKEQTQT
eukprot:CAMPEP_0181343448 /NCGR_PEP_ID=MMETSP1101-20121128/31593_1 /TAXON_ID=46948 /ORGANISM="Rhodomonas abbreviata, Strain Caron Lab Isolate" /LENGTH=145 /DNA_ID=CAMNT_0023455081 /DNA_START=590 /DNA_END=1028 /DNA_ORIENTATION=-